MSDATKKTEAAQPARTRSGRFAKGHSGNPGGRPEGSRNRASLLAERILETEAEQLVQTVIGLALEGKVPALKLCLERLLPARRDRRVRLPLGEFETVAEVSAAMTNVLRAVATGVLTPAEGESLTAMLAEKHAIIEGTDLERRVAALEAASPQQPAASPDRSRRETAS